MIKVVDDIIPQKLQDNIEHIFIEEGTSFMFAKNTIGIYETPTPVEHKNLVDTPQMVHVVLASNHSASEHWGEVKTLLYFLEDYLDCDINYIDRIKVNILIPAPGTHRDSFNYPHIDLGHVDIKSFLRNDNHWYSAVYYVNDSDGDTFIFESKDYATLDCDKIEKRVSPKKGRFTIFDVEHWHASSNPTKGCRAIVNFVFSTKEPIQ